LRPDQIRAFGFGSSGLPTSRALAAHGQAPRSIAPPRGANPLRWADTRALLRTTARVSRHRATGPRRAARRRPHHSVEASMAKPNRPALDDDQTGCSARA
jgi:hypothetical protein